MISEQAMKDCMYVLGACTRAHIKVESMRIKNLADVCSGKKEITYSEEDVLKVIEEEGIGYNDIQGMLYHR